MAVRRNSIAVIMAFVVVAITFMVLLYQVFLLRFEYGDVYPPYSSLRSDPLGTRVFYESLTTLPGLDVRRNHQDFRHLPDGAGRTLIFAGTTDSADPLKVIESIEIFVHSGGRLCIAFAPLPSELRWISKKEKKEKEEGEEEEKEEKKGEGGDEDGAADEDKEDEANKNIHYVNIKDRWGFGIEREDIPWKTKRTLVKRQVNDARLPESLGWRSPEFFTELADHWDTLYTRSDHPVVIERRFGDGSIVLCSDSYFLSNEALQLYRPSGFLAWMIGPNSSIIMDEAHLGVVQKSGVMVLMRHYRLHLVLLSVLVLALLFAWRNAMSLVPKHGREEEEFESFEESGRDASAGLNNLLRRTVPKKELLRVCCREWQSDFGREKHYAAEAHSQMQRILQQADGTRTAAGDVAAGYRRIVAMLKDRPVAPTGSTDR